MGLTHPADLDAWSRWQRAHQPWTRRARGALDRLRGTGAPVAVLARGGATPRVVVALDARTPTALGALLRPVLGLPPEEVAVLARGPLGDLVPGGWAVSSGPAPQLLDDVLGPGSVVLALGHYLGLGAAAHAAAGARRARFVTVQHGLMTPYAPPLAPGTTLLAWSAADGEFWRSGREDVDVRVVGSQLLWDAAERRAVPVGSGSRPVFLGQLHGAELPRRVLAAAAEGFCRETGAAYRPHPAETDRRSRATHRRWERAGIVVDRSGVPLRDLDRPVVGVFSTGVLEAAASGLPSWVHLPDPPSWVREFWERYRLSSWGGAPTPSPERPPVEPSRAVAAVLEGMMWA